MSQAILSNGIIFGRLFFISEINYSPTQNIFSRLSIITFRKYTENFKSSVIIDAIVSREKVICDLFSNISISFSFNSYLFRQITTSLKSLAVGALHFSSFFFAKFPHLLSRSQCRGKNCCY